jgi:hypothetical protein
MAPTYQDVINLLGASATNRTMEKKMTEYKMQVLVTFAAQDIMRQVAREIPGLSAKAALVFADSFQSTIRRNRAKRLMRMYKEIGNEATMAVVKSYDKHHKNAILSGYRKGDRYSGGVMRKALASPNMYRAAQDGLTFGNTGWLNGQAKQWARLNFGAGPRGTQTPQSPPMRMTLFGTVYPIDFALNRPARPAFRTPQNGRGFWVMPGGQVQPWSDARRGQDKFFLMTREMAQGKTWKKNDQGETLVSGPTLSMGFQGSRYMDAGVKTIVELFPIGIAKVLGEWLDQAKRGKGGKYTAKLTPSKAVINELDRKMSVEIKNFRDTANSQREQARRMALIARL